MNPAWGSHHGELDFGLLSSDARTYLENCGGTFGTPIERLLKINEPAVILYRNHGIDLSKDYLQIDVCAQHNNGGLAANLWWESNIKHFFPVGEVCGTFGVYRPGGSALNSTQVGSFRAAQYISRHYITPPLCVEDFMEIVASQAKEKMSLAQQAKGRNTEQFDMDKLRNTIQANMSKNGAIFRSSENCGEGIAFCKKALSELANQASIRKSHEICDFFIIRDILITQLVYLSAIEAYILKGGQSRGSYLVHDKTGELPLESFPEEFRFSNDGGKLDELVCEIELDISRDYHCDISWMKRRPIPREDNWFEVVWNDYMQNRIIR